MVGALSGEHRDRSVNCVKGRTEFSEQHFAVAHGCSRCLSAQWRAMASISTMDLPGRQSGMGPGSEGDRCKCAVEPVSQAHGGLGVGAAG